MQVQFDNQKVAELFYDLTNVVGSSNLITKKCGVELAKQIKKRYIQLIAFNTFGELLQSRIAKVEALLGDKKGAYSMHLTANYRLIIQPIVIQNRVDELNRCDTVIIKGVIDYHGKSRNNWLIP